MAYFAGNAVYIDGFQTIYIQECGFKQNYGRNQASGSALHIEGKLTDEYKMPENEESEVLALRLLTDGSDTIPQTENDIKLNAVTFEENFGGSKGAAMNILNVANIPFEVDVGSRFEKNVCAFSEIEEELALPFWNYLSNKQFAMNFFSFDDTC